jgi:hypothetical protein
MFAFARSVRARVAADSPLNALIAEAHIERYEQWWEDVEAGEVDPDDDYFDEVIDNELSAAFDGLATTKTRPTDRWAWSLFVTVFDYSGDSVRAERAIKRLSD